MASGGARSAAIPATQHKESKDAASSAVSRTRSGDLLEGQVKWSPSVELPAEHRRPLPKFVSVKEVLESQRSSLEKDLELAKVSFKRIVEVVGHPITFDAAKRPGCLEKNRFRSALPNDSTRVRLRQRPGLHLDREDADYINANLLEYPLAGSALRYIAAQGPLASTVLDFWTMVWEQRVHVIVMLTDLQDEFGREACARYWPSPAAPRMQHGEYVVEALQETRYAEFTVSMLQLSTEAGGAARRVAHIQHVRWPDFGVPEQPGGVLQLHECVRSHQLVLDDTAPLLVHCTAGLGRTGVYVLVDVLLRLVMANTVPNAEAILSVLREQRVGLVQTEEQYAFALRVALAKVYAEIKAGDGEG